MTEARDRSLTWQIGLASFGILALELAMIRWISGQIRVFAYFSNVVLIGAFLGMGLGVALGRRCPGLFHWTLPALLPLSVVLAFAEPLGLMRMRFPDPAIHLWGAESVTRVPAELVVNLLVFMGLFCATAAVFLLAGAAVGRLFGQLPPLTAYTADLLGALAGVLAMTAATFFGAGPAVWLALGCLPFALLSGRPAAWLSLAGVVALGWQSGQTAVFSPYNRIDLGTDEVGTVLSVNRDFHQYMHDLSDDALMDPRRSPQVRARLAQIRRAYDLPFVINDRRHRALIVGAGTGNDVRAARRNGYQEVYSVDIDGTIIELGRRLHPERAYDDPRVVRVVNDARAFFEQHRGAAFDVVSYGLLDSHAMFTSLSSLRLDNYVYTEEGIRAAWRHVTPEGHLSIAFSVYGGPWLADRLYWTIALATGMEPAMIYHGMHHGVTFVVSRDSGALHLDRVRGFERVVPHAGRHQVSTTSDDWPFLYVRPGVFPWGYVTVLAAVLLIALGATRWTFGRDVTGSRFDTALFLMGAAFLLIETRGVTTLSLLFGSTWLVNAGVFAGILAMALLANLFVARFQPRRLTPWFLALWLATLVVWAVDRSALNALSLALRGTAGSLINALPVGFAGVIVSILLARSSQPVAALGSNLLGAVVGGSLEYLSTLLGLKALALLALILYLSAFLVIQRSERRAGAGAGGVGP